MFPATNPTSTLDEFVKTEKIVLTKHNHSLSFDTGSEHIKYDRAENNIKCFIPQTDFVFEEGDCSASKRCDKVIDEPRPVHVFVEISQFNNFNQTSENGGAIHLVNCCLTCTDTPFTNCAAKEGGGGAIYIKNELDYRNNITLSGLTFTECEAKYGGDIYIYSESSRVPVQIASCIFIRNRVIESSDIELTGGNAVFLNTRIGNIDDCIFTENTGSESACKVLTSFKKKSSASLIRKIKIDANSVIFNNCVFKADSQSKSSIHFIIGDETSKAEVNKCTFIGDLNDGAHHIDEEIISNNSPRLKIKACKFSHGIRKSLKLDPKHDPSLIDYDDQVFNYSENVESKQCTWKLIVAVAAPTLAVVSIFVVVAIVIRKKKLSENNDDQDNVESAANSSNNESSLI